MTDSITTSSPAPAGRSTTYSGDVDRPIALLDGSTELRPVDRSCCGTLSVRPIVTGV